MTTRIDNIFDLFVEDLGLELVPDWGKGFQYSGRDKGAPPKTRDEIIQSDPFTAFIDGCEGNPRKFNQKQGLKGMADPMSEENRSAKEPLGAVVGQALDLLLETGAIGDREIEHFLPGRVYNEYYDRGAAYHGRF